MTSHYTHTVCLECGHTQAADVMSAACSQCGSTWLDARYDYEAVAQVWPEAVKRRDSSLWRYAELLPLDTPDLEISLQEGYTPLLRLYPYERHYAHEGIYVKDERQGPTSSFKDRQAALAVTALRRAGIRECVVASTGNAGAAYAAYCARAGIRLWLFLTSLVPAEKMREAALYGAEVVKVSGTYDEAKHVAAEFAQRKGIYFDRGARSIPGKESMKTLAFEIAEQLGLATMPDGRWRAPDWYVQAVSGGIGPMGVWKGFSELYQMGLTDRMPRLAIVQATGCAPMVQAFNAGMEKAEPVVPRTLITVLATGDPGYSYRFLREAVLSNGGTMIAIEDGETFAAMRRVASRAGLSVEPATAVAFAGLEKLLSEGVIDAGETVVLNCSGHTFPAESHVLGDQYLLDLQLSETGAARSREEGLRAALEGLDEQVKTVLVVDDEPSQRRLIRRMLQAHKRYRVFEARSGIDALKQIEDQKPDLIIADLTMPEMDGFTLLEQLKWNPDTAAIPVMVVSARNLSNEDLQLLDSYSESIWLKGNYDTRELVEHVVTLLGDTPPALAARREAPQHETPAPTPPPGKMAQPTILVIDDNAADRRLVRHLLESSGSYYVIEAENGRDGLKAIYKYRPDLVILDLILPDIDGFTILEILNEDLNLNQIPIVVYSAKGFTSEEQEHWQGQIESIIEKSKIDKSQFITVVNKALS